jgi:hypothetical protein
MDGLLIKGYKYPSMGIRHLSECPEVFDAIPLRLIGESIDKGVYCNIG